MVSGAIGSVTGLKRGGRSVAEVRLHLRHSIFEMCPTCTALLTHDLPLIVGVVTAAIGCVPLWPEGQQLLT
jgi:hypothetical protein